MTKPVPYPADTRAKGWRFELDHERIRQSDTWAIAPSDVRPWLLMLWMVAWEQTPCASLPDDDALIAARIGMQAKTFAKHKAVILRGWWKAEDGRLYHDVMVERVAAMLAKRDRDQIRISALRGGEPYRRFRSVVLERDGNACAYCGATGVALQLDHVVPRSRGGSDYPSNLTPACKPCNTSKGARTPQEWRSRA